MLCYLVPPYLYTFKLAIFFFLLILQFILQVTSPYGNNLHHAENVTHGQFAFTTTETGNYLACFTVDGHVKEGSSLSVSLDWRTGITAKDWESVAKKDKIDVSSSFAFYPQLLTDVQILHWTLLFSLLY